MEVHTHTYSAIQINAYDPTRTTVLRNAFARETRCRFRELSTVIRKAIVEEDCFGLQGGFYQLTPPIRQAFAFPRSADKVSAFMEWLQVQIDRGILEVRELAQVGVGVEGAWTNKYIYDSYKRGVIRARYELQKAGFPVPGIDATGGIEISLSTPFHLDRLGLLYTRTFSGLKGITTAMDTQISRVLAQGIADGDNPRLLARKLISTINGTGMGDLTITDTLGRFIPAQRRAEMLARTEIIRAHHNATIQEYRNWAVEGVVVKAEWMSAGDDRACNRCLDLTGTVYRLDVIEKMIPLHPNCRCIALPYKTEEKVIREREERAIVSEPITKKRVPVSSDATYGGQDMGWTEKHTGDITLEKDTLFLHSSDKRIRAFKNKNTCFFTEDHLMHMAKLEEKFEGVKRSREYCYVLRLKKGTTVSTYGTNEIRYVLSGSDEIYRAGYYDLIDLAKPIYIPEEKIFFKWQERIIRQKNEFHIDSKLLEQLLNQ